MTNFRHLIGPTILGAVFQMAAVHHYFDESHVDGRMERISAAQKGGIVEIKDAVKATGELGWPFALGAGIFTFTRRPVGRAVDKQFDKFFDKQLNSLFPGFD